MSLGLLSPPSYTNSLLRVLLPPLCVFLKIAFIAPDCFNNSQESFKRAVDDRENIQSERSQRNNWSFPCFLIWCLLKGGGSQEVYPHLKTEKKNSHCVKTYWFCRGPPRQKLIISTMKTKPDHLEATLLLRQKRQLQAQVSPDRKLFFTQGWKWEIAATSVVYYLN